MPVHVVRCHAQASPESVISANWETESQCTDTSERTVLDWLVPGAYRAPPSPPLYSLCNLLARGVLNAFIHG